MESTNYCQSCNEQSRTRRISVLGKELDVKGYICSTDGVNYPPKPADIQLQMSVSPTSYCPASCAFCIAKGTKTVNKIDLVKFEKVMTALKKENVVRGVKITGGEPCGDIKLLDEVVSILYETFGFKLELSMSTNGMGLENLHKIKYLEHMESIHISRHHYDDSINQKIFNAAVPDTKKLKEIISSVSYKDIFVLNCMLLKDYINSPEEAHRFLDYAIEVGVPKVGFMVCMPINDYAKKQTIKYGEVLRDDDPSIFFTRGFVDYEACRCRDGVYVSKTGNLIEFYGRDTNPSGCNYCRGFVYDADNHLRDGFSGNIIV